MGLIQVFKRKVVEMAAEDQRRSVVAAQQDRVARELNQGKGPLTDSKGIALMMVIAAVSVLSFLVTEFTYVAQLNQKLAYDELDQVKAHYLAKSALKLSLLRLKAYKTVKGLLSSKDNAAAAGAVPKSVIDKIWSFPFVYPIPTNIPGMTLGDKDAITKFQKESSLEGHFSSVIESESSRVNLNMILAGFQGAPSPTPTPSPSQTPPTPGSTSSPTPTPSASFDPNAARQSLQDYLGSILQNQYDKDPDFQSEYRDFRLEDFMDTLVAWADPTYERKRTGMGEDIAMKRAPFYSITELHMLPGMDDQLYDLFTPNLTVSRTPGVNINAMQETVLRAIIPNMTDDEVKEFFKFRDSQDEDNQFKDTDSFFKWIENNVNAYKGHDDLIQKLQADLKKRNINLVIDETEFKITVQGTVNQSVRTIEAWVTLGSGSSPSSSPSPTPTTTPNTGASPTPQSTSVPDAGLKINFMRFI